MAIGHEAPFSPLGHRSDTTLAASEQSEVTTIWLHSWAQDLRDPKISNDGGFQIHMQNLTLQLGLSLD